MINVTGSADVPALPSGNGDAGASGPATGLPSITPWSAYDLFVIGQTIEEIAATADPPRDERDVRADVDQMRGFIRAEHGAGLSDLDCDDLHSISRLTRAMYVEGSAAAFKSAAELVLRRRDIIMKAAERQEDNA